LYTTLDDYEKEKKRVWDEGKFTLGHLLNAVRQHVIQDGFVAQDVMIKSVDGFNRQIDDVY
jgi:hypothetical protein